MAAQNQHLLQQLATLAVWLEAQVLRVERANERDAVLSSQLGAALSQLQTLHALVRELQATTDALQAARAAAEHRAAAAEAALAHAVQQAQAVPVVSQAPVPQSDKQHASQTSQTQLSFVSQATNRVNAATSPLRAHVALRASSSQTSPSHVQGAASTSVAAPSQPPAASPQQTQAAAATEVASLEAHVRALQRVVSVQEQELARLGGCWV